MFLQSSVETALVAAEAARNTATFALIGTGITALVSIGVSITVAVLNNSASRRNQKELQGLKRRHDEELANLNAAITERQSEENARRDYVYEARKRLYKECGPLLFRLSEASENALHRIYSLARTAREGDLDAGKSWLGHRGYYLTSTLYNLLVPCAVFRLLQERLTLVDLEVDARIKDQYLLAKWVYVSFTDDFSLAQVEPELRYNPSAPVAAARRENEQEEFWKQGVPLGRLDTAVDVLIKIDAQGNSRVLTYGEFEAALKADLATTEPKFGALVTIFERFHPRTRPVLWRILIAQALLHRELLRVFRNRTRSVRPIEELATKVPDDEFERLSWSKPWGPNVDTEVRQPYSAAARYFATHLPVLFDALRSPVRESDAAAQGLSGTAVTAEVGPA